MSLLALLLLAAEPIIAPTLTATETKQLTGNAVVVRSMKPINDVGIAVQALGVIDAPPREVWPVVRDCQNFVAFMPRTKASSLIEVDGAVLCHSEISLPFPLQNLWSDSSAKDRESPEGFQRSLTLVRGTYDRNTASWTVLPWGEGQSLVIYFVDTRPKIFIPDVIMRSMQGGEFPGVFAALRKRVTALREAKK
jgi:Polyketide cyclase / dehydrase and lipid transport